MFRIFLIILTAALSVSALFRIEGTLPPGVDTAALSFEYDKIHRILLPESRVDHSPIALAFYTKDSPLAREGVLPEWGGGGALGTDAIIVPVDKPFALGMETQRILLHEVVHIVLNRAFPRSHIPRWFHEGAAMTFSGEIALEEQATLSVAVVLGMLIPLDSIERVNGLSQARARLAYSQSHAVFLYLLNEYGLDDIRQILIKASRSGNFDEGVERVIGLNKVELESAVETWVRHRYGAMFIFGDGFFVWLLIVLLSIAAYVVTRVRNARRGRALALEEAQAEARGLLPEVGAASQPKTDFEKEHPVAGSLSDGDVQEEQVGDEDGEEDSDPYDDFNDYYHPDVEMEDDDDDADGPDAERPPRGLK